VDIDVTTRAALKLLVLPPGILLALLLLGWVFARKAFGRLLLLLGIGLFYGLSTPAALDWLAGQLETVPAKTFDELKRAGAEGILAFLASTRQDVEEYAGADGLSALSLARMDYALAVHRATGLPLILSGGARSDDNPAVATVAADWLEQRTGLTPAAVDAVSRDTWENAERSRELLEQLGMRRVILVTHAFHMPRARLSARTAGLDVVPAPFGLLHTPPENRESHKALDFLPQPGVLGQSYLVLHEIAGLVWYGFNQGRSAS
jgi:uncharacterized SAM-binding protein YcdF (DUF218 family)